MQTHFKVHFIGIGGIGVSALARYYLAQGWKVSGSDLVKSEITEALKRSGAQIYIGSKSLKKLSPDLVVYSPAVKSDNFELKDARELGIKAMSYPKLWANSPKNTIRSRSPVRMERVPLRQ